MGTRDILWNKSQIFRDVCVVFFCEQNKYQGLSQCVRRLILTPPPLKCYHVNCETSLLSQALYSLGEDILFRTATRYQFLLQNFGVFI